MTIEELLLAVKNSVDALNATLKANAGNLAVNTPAAETAIKPAGKPAAGDAEGTRYYDIPKHNSAVKVAPGGQAPTLESTTEITGAAFTKLDKKYKEEGAKNVQNSQTGAAAGANAASSSTSTGTQSGSQSAGPTFKDVTVKITELSKKLETEGGGRPAVLKLLASWGAARFPDAEGKKPNAELIADIEAVLNPTAEGGDLDDLGL